jgi:transcriptional regulator with XRE-family HTH domain
VRTNQDPALLSALAGEIKAGRLRLGLSQEDLAHAASLNRTFVAKLELAQTSPSLTSLFQLASGLGVAPEEFVAAVAQRLRRALRHQN